MWKLLCPDLYVNSVLEVKPEKLQEAGIKGVISDMDNTLVAWNERTVSYKMLQWMEDLKAEGFKICIVSNNSAEQGKDLARRLDVPALWYAVKPRRKSFRRAMEIMELDPFQVAVVGDQLFTDVLGGNRLGLYTILVVPISQRELWWTRMMRGLEKRVLYSLQKRGLLE